MQDSFYGCTALEKVTFEGNTTEIGENSFYNCTSLKTINLPESLTKINYNAFQNCTSLKYIYIPKNVSSIDGKFLWGCKALETIVVDSENATYRSPDGCNAIITIDGKTFVAGCKNSTIPDGIETIGAYSLRGMPIKSIVIPASVTSIGEYAFSGCSSLESVECLSETPPTLGSSSMSHGNKANCVLTVPCGCSSAYSAWANYFKEILEKEYTIDYTFIGDFDRVYAAADINGDITYNGVDFNAQNVTGYYHGKVIENGSCANMQGGFEFTLHDTTGGFVAYRNGEQVTSISNVNGACGFVSDEAWMHEPAQWIIIAKNGPQNVKTNTVLNPDGMTISYEYNYTDGTSTVTDSFSGNAFSFNVDDTDRTRISSVKLKIPVNDDNNYRPVRVLCNGVDVSYQYEEYDSNDGFLIYYIDLNADVAWDISYETSHRQTFIRRGGTQTWNVEVEYDYPVDGYEHYYYPDAIGTPLYVDFPTYHDPIAKYAYINIDVEVGKTFKVLRNGADVTEKFAEQTNYVPEGYTRHLLTEYGKVDDNGSTLAAFGFELRDPAVWEITIEEAHKMLNAYANNDVIVSVAKLVEGEEPTFSGQANAMHRWINEGETYVVKFEPQHGEELTRFDIGWVQIDIAQDSRLVRNDDGSYSFTISYGDMDESFDIMAVFGGTGRTMFVTTTSKAYTDFVVNGTRILCFNDGTKIQHLADGDTFEVWPCTGTANYDDAIEKVLLNGTDVTNDANYLKEKVETGTINDYWRYDFSTVSGSAVIQIVYKNARYDTNKDGKVSIADVTSLVNKILGKQ